MKITKNSIILNRRESREAGHHDVDGGSAGAEARREYEHKARSMARGAGHVEVFATRHGCQPWLVFACDADGADRTDDFAGYHA